MVKCINSTPILMYPLNDAPLWKPNPHGVFIFKSTYNWLIYQQSHPPQPLLPWNRLWTYLATLKVLTFLWFFWHRGLPTTNNLFLKRITLSPNCMLCHQTDSNFHSCSECPNFSDLRRHLKIHIFNPMDVIIQLTQHSMAGA